jgi:Family of unknown function (DUF6130)
MRLRRLRADRERGPRARRGQRDDGGGRRTARRSAAAAGIVVDPPLAEALARGVVVLQYRAENLRIVPVFGPVALAVSPRIGHLHVTVDDLPWDWAGASGVPIIIQNLAPGPHRVLVEFRWRKAAKPLAVCNLSWPGHPRTGFSLWSRTQKNTLQRAVGGSLNLTTANPPTRRCTKHASRATRPSKLAILSLRVRRLEGRTKDAGGSPRLITADYVKSAVARCVIGVYPSQVACLLAAGTASGREV